MTDTTSEKAEETNTYKRGTPQNVPRIVLGVNRIDTIVIYHFENQRLKFK